MTTVLDPTLPSAPPGLTGRHRTAQPGFVRGWWRGREAHPAWERPCLLVLLAVTAALYLWGLGASGWANSFYSAAVQAGSRSWRAAFYGSFDAANFITVDKPPAALWVMDLSARLFGVNAWSVLVPQALEGVAAVAVLYATIRRWFSPAAALLSGAVLAATPVAASMFRFNNPDALLVLLLVLAAYATVRALERASTWWLALAGVLIGFGFLTKMLQAFVVVPGFALVYLLGAPAPLWRRLGQLVVAGVAMIVSAAWWVAVVQLVPASSRPYIGGSQTNSLLNLIFGYNGFGRVTGNESGSVGGFGGAAGRWGPTGLTRLFGADMGTGISWLLPAALILLLAGLASTLPAKRTDRTRVALLMWGGWLVVTGLVFSLSKGIIHPYYNVALAPAVGALVGIGATAMWQRRDHLAARATLAAALVATVWWGYVLLGRNPHWYPWLRTTELVVGVVCALALVGPRLRGRLGAVVVGVGLLAAMSGTSAYALATAAAPHAGAIPSVGPTGAGGFALGGPLPTGLRQGGLGPGFPAGGVPPGVGGLGAPARFPGFGAGLGRGGPGGVPRFGGARRRTGGLLDGSRPSRALVSALGQGASRYTWVVATVGANEASGYQLASGDPVMAIGGFNGTDPAPTLQQFQALVGKGRIHYFIAGGLGAGAAGPGRGAGTSTASQITSWVESHFSAKTVAGVTLYDLTTPRPASGVISTSP